MPHCHFSSGTDSERAVTLEVGAGGTSTPTVATVPCPRSVGFSLYQMAHHSRRGSHDFPEKAIAKTEHNWFFFFLLYAIYLLCFVSYMASANLTSFQWQVGGALALTLSYVCIRGLLNLVTGSRILFRGKLALTLFSCLFSLYVQFICSVYLFSLLGQLPQYKAYEDLRHFEIFIVLS